MSLTLLMIWFIATGVITVGIIVALTLRSMGFFEHHPHGYVHQFPNEPTSRKTYDYNHDLEAHTQTLGSGGHRLSLWHRHAA